MVTKTGFYKPDVTANQADLLLLGGLLRVDLITLEGEMSVHY